MKFVGNEEGLYIDWGGESESVICASYILEENQRWFGKLMGECAKKCNRVGCYSNEVVEYLIAVGEQVTQRLIEESQRKESVFGVSFTFRSRGGAGTELKGEHREI